MKKEDTRVLRRISAMLLIILTFTVCATGCELEDVLNSVVKAKDKPTCVGELNSFQCAYKSDKTKFDINDVTLDFYYGMSFSGPPEFAIQHGVSVPGFELYFENEDGSKYLIKRVEENLVSEKYYCKYNEMTKRFDFNHFEQFTIPKELFTKSKGYINFMICGIPGSSPFIDSRDFCILTAVDINYELVGDKVILSKTCNMSIP